MFGVINIHVLNDIIGGKKTLFKQCFLDFILVSEDILSSPCNASIETGYRTDHSCPILEIKLLDTLQNEEDLGNFIILFYVIIIIFIWLKKLLQKM